MGQTIAEKILAKHCNKDIVKAGEFIEAKGFVGPIVYSYKGADLPGMSCYLMNMLGHNSFDKLDNMIYNEDHNSPPQDAEVVELFKQSRATAKKMGMKIYDREGIGHIVNVEKGDIRPGVLYVHMDPQAGNAGGIGALYTGGGRYGSSFLEALADAQITLRVPETFRVVVDGTLPSHVGGRDIWMKVLDDIEPDSAFGMVIEFAGTAIESLPIEERMIMCGNVCYSGADAGICASDEKTQQWFKENVGIEVDILKSDEDAEFAKVLHYKAEDFAPMVSYPPQIFTSKPANNFREIKVNQCIIGTCMGGTLRDLRAIAKILDGRKVAEGVRMLVSPATQKIYAQAGEEGLLSIIASSGATILPPTCDVCLGVLGPLSDGEVGISQQTLNTPGRSGSMKADIYLANASVIAATAVTGYITDPSELDN